MPPRRTPCPRVAFDFSTDALREIDRFFKEEHTVIILLTMREILDEQIARSWPE